MASEIIVSINVQSGKAEVGLGKAKAGVDKLAAAEKRLADANADGAIKIAQINLQTKERIQLNNQAAAETLKNVNKTSGQFRTQVGLNNAILTEAGRAASDIRFGFNGVANNVGQIASLFGSLITTSDNVGKSLMQLVKSLVGVGGFLIAVQLLIAYGDQIYSFFFNTSAAAADLRKKMESLLKPIKQNRLELLSYIGVLKDTTSSEEARIEALDKLGKAVPDAVDDNGELKISYTELGLAVEDYVEQLTIRAEVEAIIELNSEKFSKRRKVRALGEIKDEAKRNEAIKKYLDEEIGLFEASGRSRAEQRKFDRLSEEEQNKIRFKSLKERIENEAKEVQDSIIALQKKLKGVRKEDESGSGTNRADNLTQFLDLSKKIQAARADVRKGAAIDDMDAIRIQGENEEKAVEAQAEVFLDKQKQRLERKLITQEQYNDSELQAKEELAEAIEAIQDKTDNREINLQGKRNEKANQLNIDASFIREEIMLNEELMEDRILGRRATSLLNFQQERLNTEIEGLKARLEAEELHVEQRAKLQKQLSQAELKESGIRTRIADAEANAKIQSLTLVSSALNVASKIAGENSKAGKALAVSAALVSTYLSAQKAYESQFTPLATVDSPVRATLAAAVAVASGLANVKAILSTNPSGQSSMGGGGANVTAPSFNVVGASATNQLAQTVAGQINEPLRAYVVGSDISDQQELDRSIINTAGIG